MCMCVCLCDWIIFSVGFLADFYVAYPVFQLTEWPDGRFAGSLSSWLIGCFVVCLAGCFVCVSRRTADSTSSSRYAVFYLVHCAMGEVQEPDRLFFFWYCHFLHTKYNRHTDMSLI
jgi:hypothetical protein